MSGVFVPAHPYERIDGSVSAFDRLPHEARYQLAAGWLTEGDTVVDAACGTGYGAPILGAGARCRYLGVERDLGVLEGEARWLAGTTGVAYSQADLEIWGGPSTPFDVAVVLETIEHLEDPAALVAWTQRARRAVIVSCPIVPTVGGNPFHRHDYRPGEIELFWRNMKPLAFFEQPREGTGIWVFGQWEPR